MEVIDVLNVVTGKELVYGEPILTEEECEKARKELYQLKLDPIREMSIDMLLGTLVHPIKQL